MSSMHCSDIELMLISLIFHSLVITQYFSGSLNHFNIQPYFWVHSSLWYGSVTISVIDIIWSFDKLLCSIPCVKWPLKCTKLQTKLIVILDQNFRSGIKDTRATNITVIKAAGKFILLHCTWNEWATFPVIQTKYRRIWFVFLPLST